MNKNVYLTEKNLLSDGLVRIYKKYQDGQVEVIQQTDANKEGFSKNLIVSRGKSLLLTNIYSVNGESDRITFAKVGTGGAVDPSGLFLKSPSLDLVDLYLPAVSIPVNKTGEDLLANTITLVACVDNAQANGLILNEAGFFSSSGIMFNIKTFPGVLKKSSFSLNFEWIIRVL